MSRASNGFTWPEERARSPCKPARKRMTPRKPEARSEFTTAKIHTAAESNAKLLAPAKVEQRLCGPLGPVKKISGPTTPSQEKTGPLGRIDNHTEKEKQYSNSAAHRAQKPNGRKNKSVRIGWTRASRPLSFCQPGVTTNKR